MPTNSKCLGLILTLLVSLTFGCGKADIPELGYVTGTVTMDGKPLTGATIAFLPEKGRASTSEVDAEGKYELFYKKGFAGTKVGPSEVSVSWASGGSPAIPERYGLNSSELKADVKAGNNTFDFDLKSDPGSAEKAPEGPPVLD